MIITPRGWIMQFLKKQMNGLTGHIEQAGFPFNCVQWGEKDYTLENGGNPGWWVYEQTAYWLDGYVRCAALLQDEAALQRGAKMIYKVLDNADDDGYLGPKFLKPNCPWNRWAHVVFFRSCMALFEVTGDARIPKQLTAHYLNSPADYSQARDICNVEIMLWLYGINGKKELLELAIHSYENYNSHTVDDNCDAQAMTAKKPYAHGVTYNEYFKLGAILYRYTGNKKYLEASKRGFRKIDQYFMLPGGGPCSNEFLISNHYMQSVETCDVTDYTWSLSYMQDITEEGSYGDKIEKCVFNAGIGAVLENFRGLQYFSCANQVIADCHSNHNRFYCGSSWMSYRPNPGTECCPGNVNRFMPNYVLNSWKQKENIIFCMLYGACRMETMINGGKVVIEEQTNYPFEETVRFKIQTKTPFKLRLRMPRWADRMELLMDGHQKKTKICKGFAEIFVSQSCCIEVSFPCSIQAHRKNGRIWFSRGSLVYSLGMKGHRERDLEASRSSEAFPAYNIYPDKPWQYAISGQPIFVSMPQAQEFDLDVQLPHLEVAATEITNLKLVQRKQVLRVYDLYSKKSQKIKGDFRFTPALPATNRLEYGDVKKIRLYPYGACKLRMTVFPEKPFDRYTKSV